MKEVDGGKYTFIKQPAGEVEILRYGEPWVRIEAGCNAITALLSEHEALSEQVTTWRGVAQFAEHYMLRISDPEVRRMFEHHLKIAREADKNGAP